MVEHGFLVLPADATEVAQEAATAGHHLREGDLLQTNPKNSRCLRTERFIEVDGVFPYFYTSIYLKYCNI